jgi:enamine deaminase RidA (YjgF/YER057c/UK114 family)
MKIAALTFSLIAAIALSDPVLSNNAPSKRTINPSRLMDTRNYGYSQATAVGPGMTAIYISGQIGISEEGPNDFQSQVDRAFDNLLAVLRAANGRVSDLVKITLLVKNHDEEKMRYLVEKRRHLFGDDPPASTLIPVPTLALTPLEFEVDAIAVVHD